MEKSHVGMLHDVCPICLSEVDTTILLDKRLRPSLEKDNYQIGDICKECQKHIDDGYVALIVVDAPGNGGKASLSEMHEYRTGELAFLKRTAVEAIFDHPAGTDFPFVFIDTDAANMLKKMQEDFAKNS